jgi:type VI secretion system ImpJ/VasE family protein
MLLSPQHLQAFSRELGARILRGDTIGSVGAHGLLELEIDAAALGRDLMTVVACELVLRDGTHVRVPELADLEPRSFLEFFKGPELDVWIGVPAARAGVPQIGADQERAWRYKVVVQEVADENLLDSGRPIDLRRLQARLFFGEEDRSGYECVPAARLVRRGRPVVRSELAPDFIPPLLVCGASPVMMKELKALAVAVRGQARDLAARLPATASLSSADKGADVAGFVRLQAVNQSLALLDQVAGLPQLHPHAAYQALAQVVGSLAIFGADRTTPPLAIYDHDQPEKIFRAAFEAVRTLCAAEVSLPYDAIPFKADAVREGIFEAELPAEWLGGRAHIYLAVSIAKPAEEVVDHVANCVKLISAKDVERFLTGVVPGIELTFERQPPLSFPKRPDLHFFRIGTEGASREQWTQVEQDRRIVLLTFVSAIGEVRFHMYVEQKR